MDVYIFSLRSRRQSKAWGGARQRGTPGTTSDLSYQPAKRVTAIEPISMMMKERSDCRPFHGLDGIGYAIFLGFRAAALHPRLYSGARVRGLRFDICASGKNSGKDKGLKITAKSKCRYALAETLALCAMVIGLSASFSIRGFGQELEAAQLFVQSVNSSNAAQKLLREGRELVGERKWAAATTKFNDLIRAYPRYKNLDAALYWLAFCLKQQGRPREADQTLERLIKEYPRSDWGDDALALRIELAESLGNLEVVGEVLDRHEKTIERAQKAIEKTVERAQKAIEREQKAIGRGEGEQKAIGREKKAIEREQGIRERGQRITDKDDPNEALRLIALQSLFQADPERAMSLAVGFLSQDSKASATIQEAALSLIARHGGEKAWPALVDTARNQSIAESVREQAVYWIAHQNREQVTEALIQLYDGEKTAELKERLLYWLAHSDSERARVKIVEVARGGDSSELRERAIYWIAHRSGEQSFNPLNELYGAEKDPAIKERILYWFAHSSDPRAQAKVDDIARADASPELRDRAIYWIAHRSGPGAADFLVRLYDEQKEEEAKERILYWLGHRGGKAGLQKLFAVARSDSSQNLRERAVHYIGQSKDPEAIKLLEQILK
jgi:Tetratricopeptide repeat/HEAT repeats